MALSVNLLTTTAQCDAIIATLDERLRIITKREGDFDYQRDNATDDATNVSARLVRLTSKITELTSSLATQTPGTDEHRRTDEELTDAQYEQKKRSFRQADREPVYLVLREVDVDDAQGRIARLTTSRTAVVTRRAEL
ncbi:hypothetical protein [Hymenobacter negativus]|uniref:Uncharacterized protein n=1 Tax=Hymenobacter negativus TaxID=2795026 RepID=A0ABS3Q9I7_9BACT|nr:hypothetical protein [Hymenobacter negativus]MBO2007916.1 hypothetical protein [Hymenobacter negativus]